MDLQEYERVYRAERCHWWYLGMERISRALISHRIRPKTALRILDAGCGTGGSMASFLADYGTVTGFDLSSRALHFCRKRHLSRLARASVEAIPFPDRSFDLVTSFDVLYERGVGDDSRALGELARVLAPGGHLLLRLPAYDWLRGGHDRVIHTARRYTAGRVRNLLEAGGFRVRALSYANTLLFPAALVKRWGERVRPSRSPRSDLEIRPGLLNGSLRLILSAEAPFAARGCLPFGLSVVALGQRAFP
jgi:SAM-dependent methyltransferase